MADETLVGGRGCRYSGAAAVMEELTGLENKATPTQGAGPVKSDNQGGSNRSIATIGWPGEGPTCSNLRTIFP